MTYWAHSDPDGLPVEHPNARWQPLAEHLEHTGSLARTLAELAVPGYTHFHDLAERAGLLHDFGKYADGFQRMIQKGTGRCQHAIHGAALAFGGWGASHIAQAVAGHHAGIPDAAGDLKERIKQFQDEALGLRDVAMGDSPRLSGLLHAPPPSLERLAERYDLFTRMLFSCVVDADRLDTAGRRLVQSSLEAPARLEALMRQIDCLSARRAGQPVNTARREVLDDCLASASLPDLILSLSAPTGGGKTMAAMAFALKRASLQPERYRRVIVVIPYLSIIEQNAQVFVDLFGKDAVLEHHSGTLHVRDDGQSTPHYHPAPEAETNYSPALRRAETENWDAPLIVTTSVRFFESLFSNHPSDLRRVHNIARSVIILDEVQVLPRSLLAALLGMIRELAENWGCTFVLSTATRPAFERGASAQDSRWPAGTVREIVRSPRELHRRLKRVEIEWRIQRPADWPEVAQWMAAHRQALCVVNTRGHASILYDELAAVCEPGSLLHLSTRMCAAHRLREIHRIRERLRRGDPCLVVSTQLIEAGVDLDFPIAFRALGPLDSIIQTAGRCDREGKLTALAGRPGGKLVVFLPRDHRMPPNEYSEAAAKTQALALQRDIQCDDLEAMSMFFERYYSEGGGLGEELIRLRREAKFATLANQFEMISSRTRDVLAPFGDGKQYINELARIGQITADLRRKLQRYTVGLPPWEFQTARSSVLWELRPGADIWIASEPAYSDARGLEFAIAPEGLIS